MELHTDQWWLEVFDAIRSAPDPGHLFERLRKYVETLGFPCCSYGIRIPDSLVTPAIAVLDNYPNSWMEHYAAQRYLAVDPTVRLGAQSSEPIVWSDELFARASSLWSDAKGAGLCVGLAQSSWGASGAFGLLSVARDAEAINQRELDHLRPRLRWLMENTHQKMQEFYTSSLARDATVKLSPREHEIMCWTAEGKTSWETAQILHISERTVNFHVHNVLVKLNAQNKIQAAVKATSLGVLAPGGEEPSARAKQAKVSDDDGVNPRPTMLLETSACHG